MAYAAGSVRVSGLARLAGCSSRPRAAPATPTPAGPHPGATPERLRFVKTAQRLGLTLDEIREILVFAERGEPPCGYVRQILANDVAAIDDRIAELRGLRDQLVTLNTRAERLPASSDGCYCHIIHAAEDAGTVPDKQPFRVRSR